MCRCEYNFTCRACLEKAAERAMAERFLSPPTTFYGTYAFGEILIHEEA